MKDIALLVGNGVNAMSQGIKWSELLDQIIDFCKDSTIHKHASKPFPLFYEEIFLNAIKRKRFAKETELKKFIGEKVSDIAGNDIHALIRKIAPAHIMTANYEFLLEGQTPKKNNSIITENTYSIFRRYNLDNISYWHVHGDCKSPQSINLGYDHYCGQLQKIRNYVVAVPDYKSDQIEKKSLYMRMRTPKGIKQINSWVDLFFMKDIHIIGLTLDFVEIDLWWLITYRARLLYYDKKINIRNKICYYIPKAYEADAGFKLDLLRANGVEVIVIDKKHGMDYYTAILNAL